MDSMVTARVPIELKRQATEVFKKLETTHSQAINDFYEHVAITGSLPELRTSTQIAYQDCPRIIDPEKITPDMKRVARAMRTIKSLGPVEWGEDEGRSYKEIIEEGRRADYLALH